MHAYVRACVRTLGGGQGENIALADAVTFSLPSVLWALSLFCPAGETGCGGGPGPGDTSEQYPSEKKLVGPVESKDLVACERKQLGHKSCLRSLSTITDFPQARQLNAWG